MNTISGIYNVPAGWQGSSVVTIEDNAQLIFDPNLQAGWNLHFQDLTIGSNVQFVLSGHNAPDSTKPATPEPGYGGGAESNGHEGRDGADGVSGGNTAGLTISTNSLTYGSFFILAVGGKGGPGGDGSRGGSGGKGSCQHAGGDGGYGGIGGRGGPGGNVENIQIEYTAARINPDLLKKGTLINVGPIATIRGGDGGLAGAGGFGGTNGGEGCSIFHTGQGQDRSGVQSGNKGTGQPGNGNSVKWIQNKK